MGKRRKPKRRREKKKRVSEKPEKDNSIIKEQPSYVSSADLIGSNEDLLRNILIYVYDKPLSRFKSVSKLWLSIISDADFTLTWHTKQVPSPSALFVYKYIDSVKFIPLDEREENSPSPNFDLSSLPFVTGHSSIKIVQSCNGLLLVYGYSGSGNDLAVFNPTTNQFKLIPKFVEMHPDDGILAFDPFKSPHYKVILSDIISYSRRYLYIYESEMDSWRVVPLGDNSSFSLVSGVYWNGAIHWSHLDKYFDLDKVCYMKMPMRPIQKEIGYFGESRGHLLLIYYKHDLAMRFDVFEMELDYSKWFVKYSVDLTALSLRFKAVGLPNPSFRFLTLIINGDRDKGEEESSLLVMYVPETKSETYMYVPQTEFETDMVISYNLQTEKLKNLCHLSLSRNYCTVWAPFTRLPATIL